MPSTAGRRLFAGTLVLGCMLHLPPGRGAPPRAFLPAPVFDEAPAAPTPAPAAPEAGDRPLPINLATALRLAGGRPIVIAAAQASERVAAAELQRARALWLPTFAAGTGYFRHDGATQGQSGNFYVNTREQFMTGATLVGVLAPADALLAPLAARQVLRARQLDVEAARNDALLATAEAYFNVQQARGQLAGTQDVVDRAVALRDKVRSLGAGLIAPADVSRARATLDEVEEALATAREQWRVASADLAQVLRLDPAALAVPLEPPHLRVTLIDPALSVDDLVPIGLTNRPELASQQALVRAALARIRQERARPLVPSIVLRGEGPGGFTAGLFASGAHGNGNPTMARSDVGVELLWTVENLGFGNRALVRERRAEQQQLLVELFRRQDLVAAEVVRAHVAVKSAGTRAARAESGLQEAQRAYADSLAELGKTTQVGDGRVLTRRAFEVVDALLALRRAYDAYYQAANDYNRAQFQLYRALGYPAAALACGQVPGGVLPVDTTRPPLMAPVGARRCS